MEVYVLGADERALRSGETDVHARAKMISNLSQGVTPSTIVVPIAAQSRNAVRSTRYPGSHAANHSQTKVSSTRRDFATRLSRSGAVSQSKNFRKTVSCAVMASSEPNRPGRSADLLIVGGGGVLGTKLGSLWLEAHPSATVVGQTNTTNNHSHMASLGISPRVGPTSEKYANVAFCAPPSGSEDYAGDVARACDMWDGTGNFIFTSSAGVYDVNDGSACDEGGPVVALGSSPRTDVLLKAEENALAVGGNVVRLVGLYHRTRGAHTFFLKQGQVARWGGYMVNLIHYEDAASLCAAVLAGSGPGAKDGLYRSEVFVGCDDRPVSFEDMMASISRAGLEGLTGEVSFTEGDGAGNLGKQMSNAKTREMLGWAPKYTSVDRFFEGARGEDWYWGLGGRSVDGMPHA